MKSLFSVFLGCAGVVLAQNQQAKQEKAPLQPMSFFVTSAGLGKGADLGGLAGADQHCQMLAQAVGEGFGDTPNQHDMLTGSQPDGRAYTDGMDHTCKNWTSSSDGTAQLGHFDRIGGGWLNYCFAVIL